MTRSRSIPTLIVSMVILWASLSSTPLAGQNVGDRVRILVSGESVVGEVTSVDGRAMMLLHDGRQQSFDKEEITRLERSAGVQSLWKKGLYYGGGVGVGAGVLYGRLVGETCDALLGANEECTEAGIKLAVVAGLVWGAIGGGLGAGVGALIRREAWTTIPIGSTTVDLSPVVAPRLGPNSQPALLLGARIRF